MEDYLNNQRKQPDAAFSHELYRKLNAADAPARRPASPALKITVAALAGAMSLGLLLGVPQVGSAAQSFLNLFRVKRITAIAVDPARLQALQGSSIDFKTLFADTIEIVKQPGEPQTAASAAQASALAGIPVRAPATLGEGVPLSEIVVSGEGIARMTADADKAAALLQALGITDVQVPAALNGAKVTITTPPVAAAMYRTARATIVLAQARSPEVDLPPGVDLAQLGEIGLRAVGMPADDARRFAQTIDWNSTLIMPIPVNAASFREVDVRGAKGLLVQANASGGNGRPAGGPNLLLTWSEGDVVFAMSGNGLSATDLLTFANALP